MANLKYIKRVLLNRVWKRTILVTVLLTVISVYCTFMIGNYQTERSIFESKYQTIIEIPKDRNSTIYFQLQVLTNRFNRAKEKAESAEISIPELKSIEVMIDVAETAFMEQNLDLAEKYVNDIHKLIAEILPRVDTSYKTNTISVFAYGNFISGKVSGDLQATKKDGTPLSVITFAVNGPPSTTDKEKVLAGCEIYPVGVSFKNTTYLIMYYDPLDIPDGWHENDLVLMQSSNNVNDQEVLFGEVDTSLHNITAPITDLGTFWILAIKPSLPISPPSFPWVPILIPSFSLALLIFIILTYKEKTRSRKSTKSLRGRTNFA